MTRSVKDLEVRQYQRRRAWDLRVTMQSECEGKSLARFLRARDWQVKVDRRLLWVVNLARVQMPEAEADIRRWYEERIGEWARNLGGVLEVGR